MNNAYVHLKNIQGGGGGEDSEVSIFQLWIWSWNDDKVLIYRIYEMTFYEKVEFIYEKGKEKE